jgi:hypothetical protein
MGCTKASQVESLEQGWGSEWCVRDAGVVVPVLTYPPYGAVERYGESSPALLHALMSSGPSISVCGSWEELRDAG